MGRVWLSCSGQTGTDPDSSEVIQIHRKQRFLTTENADRTAGAREALESAV